jgi:DNA-binding response OmpR family regulator
MKKRILIVDDEPEVCGLIKDVLETAGYKVEVSYDGKQCLEKIKSNNYSLVVMDIMMPDLSGEDVIKLMREEGAKTPVIYVTIKPKEDVNIRLVKGFVQKPFKNEELLKVVKSVI